MHCTIFLLPCRHDLEAMGPPGACLPENGLHSARRIRCSGAFARITNDSQIHIGPFWVLHTDEVEILGAERLFMTLKTRL